MSAVRGLRVRSRDLKRGASILCLIKGRPCAGYGGDGRVGAEQMMPEETRPSEDFWSLYQGRVPLSRYGRIQQAVIGSALGDMEGGEELEWRFIVLSRHTRSETKDNSKPSQGSGYTRLCQSRRRPSTPTPVALLPHIPHLDGLIRNGRCGIGQVTISGQEVHAQSQARSRGCVR